MIIDFQIGSSMSGHGHSDIYAFDCTYGIAGGDMSIGDIRLAYSVGSKLVGFDLVNDCCTYYEDNYLDEEQMDKLVSLGFVHEDLEEMKDEGLMSEWWMDIYMFICKLGCERLIVTPVRHKHVDIGGYGLFQ